MRGPEMGDVTELAKALGFAPGLGKRIEIKGMQAIINRVRSLDDESGTTGRVMALVQMLGLMMEERMMQGDPFSPNEQAAVVAEMAGQFGLNRINALRVVGAVEEMFSLAIEDLAMQEPTNGEEAVERAGSPTGGTAGIEG